MSYMRNVKAATFVSTGYNPATDVPNLLAWYRADTTTNSGGFVDQMTDKKGSVQYTQTLTKRPALVASGSDPNGRDCIVFDGVDDFLTVASPGHGALSDVTIFGVIRSVAAPASTGLPWTIQNGGALSLKVLVNAGATDPVFIYYNPSNTLSSRPIEALSSGATIYAASAPRIFCVRHNSAAAASATPITRSRLGTPRTTNNTSNATISTIVASAAAFGAIPNGTAGFLGFGLYEWMICNALLSDAQVNAVELYLARYYGLL